MTLSRHTPVHEVIKDLPTTGITVAELARDRGSNHSELYAKLLMACEGDQLKFLTALYDEMVPDVDVTSMWICLIKAGFFPDLLNPKAPMARDLISAVQMAINNTKERFTHGQPHVCQRCKRLRR